MSQDVTVMKTLNVYSLFWETWHKVLAQEEPFRLVALLGQLGWGGLSEDCVKMRRERKKLKDEFSRVKFYKQFEQIAPDL